ncbi:hypothetical protein AAFC00_006558 [Neodothiora populina]|uniref:Major facilitator superfamily (MFS) profile domain-containing protein n=1 Tax=Neodothiora populina TaxID=2781224 RepID=A0ABR3PAM7_9PEZI
MSWNNDPKMEVSNIEYATSPSPSLGDKDNFDVQEHVVREFDVKEGYVLEAQEGETRLKTALNGHTVLIPQPSDDAEDPLNWSPKKKALLLIVVSLTAALPDYGSAVGAVTLIAQAKIWGLSPDTVNHSAVGNVLMLGIGGIFAIVMASYVGRAPTIFWFLVLALATAIWCAAAQSFESFMAARILNGFFETVSQAIGLTFIQDVFFFHERVRKINIWSAFVILSPFVGPMITAFMLTSQPWQSAFWLYTALTGAFLILVVLFLDETYYDRRIAPSHQPPRKSRMLRLVGVEQMKSRKLRNTLWQSVMRPVKVISKPTVLLSCIYYLLIFSWSVGINTTLSIFLTNLYGFDFKGIGCFYFTPIVGALVGEITGHWIHDFIAKRYIKTHNGHFNPEVRLRAAYIATPFLCAGLVLLGFSLERGWHYMVTSVAWGFYVFGIMVTTVTINSYNLDSYPEASGEVAAWINVFRVTGGTVISYFQVKWAAKSGPIISFGVQGAVCVAAFIIILVLQKFGKAMRAKSGPLNFHTD